MMRKNLFKYWKFLGLALVLTLFTASFVEWTISNELSGSHVQCEEFVDADVQSENDQWIDFAGIIGIIELPQVIEMLPGSICKKLNFQDAELANVKFRSFMVMNHQFKFAC